MTPYCVKDMRSSGTSSGRTSTTTTPSTAVKAMEEAMSSPSAPMDRGHGGDGGVAADGIAAGDEDRHPLRQAEDPADGVARRDRHDDDEGDADQQRRPDREHGADAHGGAEEHDGDLEQRLGAELETGVPKAGGCPRAADGDAEQDGEDQRLQPGPAHEADLDRLQQVGRGRHEQAETDAGQERSGRKTERGIRDPGVGEHEHLRHLLAPHRMFGLFEYMQRFVRCD